VVGHDLTPCNTYCNILELLFFCNWEDHFYHWKQQTALSPQLISAIYSCVLCHMTEFIGRTFWPIIFYYGWTQGSCVHILFCDRMLYLSLQNIIINLQESLSFLNCLNLILHSDLSLSSFLCGYNATQTQTLCVVNMISENYSMAQLQADECGM